MKRLRDVSIRRKVTLAILVTSLAELLLACGALVAYELVTFRRAMVRDLTVLADVLGRNSTAALDFDDAKDATKTLSALAAEQHIIGARLYDKEGKPFADYARAGAAAELPDLPPPEGHRFERDSLVLSLPVLFEGKQVGTISLRGDLGHLYERLKSYGLIVAVVVAVAFLITFVISSGMQRVISGPILALADTARVVADKQDYSVRAARHGRDEIGLLTDAMNQMLSEIETGQIALQQANQSLEAQAGQLQDANQSLEAQAKQLQHANGLLEAQAAQITEIVGVLGSSARQILALSTQVAASATETAAAVTETSTTVEEVKHTALLSSQKTKQVSEGAQRVAQISQAGKTSTAQTVSGMNRIYEQMQSIAHSLLRLSEQTQTIGNIITTVEDLAQQSNLLAVNAAIEAAKAGEHGKGFAVVAHEVRNLAAQSRQATTEVRTILGEIQRATNAAVMATDQGTRVVEDGVKQSGEAGEAIVVLASNITDAAQAASQIAVSSQQQLAGMDQVAQAMGNIKHASLQNVDSARHLELAAKDLSALGKRLQELVGHCQVPDAPPAEVVGQRRPPDDGHDALSNGARERAEVGSPVHPVP